MNQQNPTSDKHVSSLLLFFFVLLSCVGVLSWGSCHVDWLKIFFSRTSYYIIFTLTFVWALTLLHAGLNKKADILHFLNVHKKAIGLCLLMSCIVFGSLDHYHRALSDETNMLSMARNMTFNKKVDNVTEGYWYYGWFRTSKEVLDKRPLMFPFFTHLCHVFLGYNALNVYVLNFFSLSGLLLVIYLILRPYVSELLALASIVLVVSQPLVSIVSVSGCFEIFNLFFLGLSFLSLRWFLASRSSVSLQVLFMNLLMLANIRYESMIIFGIVFLFLSFARRIKEEHFEKPYVFLISPLFLLPWFEQRYLTSLQNDPNFSTTWTHLFKWSHVWPNAVVLGQYLCDVSGARGFDGVLNVAGVIACIAAVYLMIKKYRCITSDQKLMFFIFLSVFMFLLVGALAYEEGNCHIYPVVRYYFLEAIVLTIMPLAVLSYLLKDNQRLFLRAAFLAAICLFVYYHPVAIEDKLANNMFIVRKDRFVMEFIKQHPQKNALFIFDRPGELVVYNHGAISFSTANREKEKILGQYRDHLFGPVYAIQDISCRDLKPRAGFVLDDDYRLEPLAQEQIIGTYFIQIARVIPPPELPRNVNIRN